MAYLKLFKELWHYAGKDRWKVVLYILLHFLAVLSLLANPMVFAQILNTIQVSDRAHVMSGVTFWVGIWSGLFIWFNILHRFARYLEFNVGYKVKQRFLNRHYRIVTELPLKWHNDHHSGDTINRINLAATALHDFSIMQFLYIEYFLTFWGTLIALSFLSWQISLIAFIVSVITILLISMFDKRLVGLYRELNEINHRISATFFDYVSNIKTIVTLRLGDRTAAEFDRRIGQGYRPYMHAESWVNMLKWFTVTLCMMVLEVGVIFYYIWLQLVRNSTILLGNIAAVFQYLQQLSSTFGNIAREYQQVIHWQANYDAARSISSALPDIKAEHENVQWKKIDIKGLTFGYSNERPTLSDISLSFTKGEKIALVGESGSGKSSLMALIRGLYEPFSVSLGIDGQPFDSLAPLAGMTTLIPQEPEIFENTILYNITVGLDYPPDAVNEALRISCFDKVVERLPLGLASDVREKGVSLSGGERQRLALARGILAAANSSIILMDEPTSSVDAHNEMTIYENIFGHYHDRAIISSVHRLHLLSRFDRIIVLDRGRVAQAGPLRQLREEQGPFRTLWEKYRDIEQG